MIVLGNDKVSSTPENLRFTEDYTVKDRRSLNVETSHLEQSHLRSYPLVELCRRPNLSSFLFFFVILYITYMWPKTRILLLTRRKQAIVVFLRTVFSCVQSL